MHKIILVITYIETKRNLWLWNLHIIQIWYNFFIYHW